MGCNKLVLFSTSLYVLALLIAFNEARPADDQKVHHHHHHDPHYSRVVKEVIDKLSDETIGSIASKLPDDLVGSLLDTPDASVVGKLVKDLPKQDFEDAIIDIPDSEGAVLVKTLKDLPPSIARLPLSQIPSKIVELPDSLNGKLLAELPTKTKIELARRFKKGTVGKVVKDIPSDEFTKIIRKNANTLHKELTPELIAEIIKDLKDVQIGDIADAIPAKFVGEIAKRLTSSEVTTLFQEVPLEDREAADKYIPIKDIRKFFKGLSKKKLKDAFGDKASKLSEMSDDELIDATEHVDLHKLAKLYLLLPDVDAGDNIQGLKPEEVGKFLHELPEDELEAIIQSVLNKIFGNLPKGGK